MSKHTYADSTLKSWTKDELIHQIRILERNLAVNKSSQQAENFEAKEARRMSEYIERKAVMKIIDDYGTTHGSVLGSHSGAVDAVGDIIYNLPTADVAPVVRCKECEHWGTRKADGYGFCCIWGASVKEDAFCSSGVKKAKIDGGGKDV